MYNLTLLRDISTFKHISPYITKLENKTFFFACTHTHKQSTWGIRATDQINATHLRDAHIHTVATILCSLHAFLIRIGLAPPLHPTNYHTAPTSPTLPPSLSLRFYPLTPTSASVIATVWLQEHLEKVIFPYLFSQFSVVCEVYSTVTVCVN